MQDVPFVAVLSSTSKKTIVKSIVSFCGLSSGLFSALAKPDSPYFTEQCSSLTPLWAKELNNTVWMFLLQCRHKAEAANYRANCPLQTPNKYMLLTTRFSGRSGGKTLLYIIINPSDTNRLLCRNGGREIGRGKKKCQAKCHFLKKTTMLSGGLTFKE